jgi:DnaK suppressor protein
MNKSKAASGQATQQDAKPDEAKLKPRPESHASAASKVESRSTKGVKAAQTSDGNDVVGDDFEKTAVSKVSEVATKTSKSTPSVTPDVPLLSDMNPAQLAFFKARLQSLEKELLKNAGETTEHLRETVLVPDPADRATIEEEHALELRTRDRERKLLKKVQQSILAIDAGDYGWCEETGEPIGIPRLLARPTATLSLEAQQRRELKQKLYGD